MFCMQLTELDLWHPYGLPKLPGLSPKCRKGGVLGMVESVLNPTETEEVLR